MSKLRFIGLYMALMVAFATSVAAQSAFQYSYVPKKVYENQLFPVTIVGPDNSPTLTFDTSSLIQPIFRKPLEVKNGDETFYTFYFKADKVDVRIPQVFISSMDEETSLESISISLSKLKSDKNYAKVLAAELKIKSQQVSNYDGKNHIVTLALEAYEANLEDMVLNNVLEYGVEHIKRDNAKVTAEFYAVLPREQKELHFNYFNTIKKRFVDFKIPVKVANASVTTQSDLNPKVDAFERLKRYTLIFFSVFFLLMFVWKRDFFYLILGVISIITLLTFYIPHKKVCVKQGSPLYILPTTTSTVGTRVESRLDTMLLGTRGDFNKIEYKKGIIGWVKNEDLCNP